MEKEKIERINQLARKSRTPEGLTAQERSEQQALRLAYLEEFRASFTAQLEHTVIERPDGTREKLTKKPSAEGEQVWLEKEEQAVASLEEEEARQGAERRDKPTDSNAAKKPGSLADH